ncbi:MAG TPA: response regulator, partial [Pyrinomonadaceae bacterium]|nr:response regulator [Pyrinomonadaceae bacterium]
MKTEQMRPTVLVVNDDPKVLELLSVILEQEDYKVMTTGSGQTALEIASRVEPDIVISDVVMPEVDGLELCRRLKQDPRTAYVPILLASALRTGKRSNLNALTAGADDYLEMPFRRQELLVKVARLTERHRIERRYREIVEQAADIIYTRDMQGRITSINEAGARFFGRPVSELVGASLNDLIGEDAARETLAKTSEDSSAEPPRWVHCVKDAQGVARYLEGAPTIMRDADGNAVGVRSVVRDITERKRAEEAIRESEERFRAQYKGFPVPTYSWRKVEDDFELVDYSDSAMAFTQGRVSELVGQRASVFYQGEKRQVFEAISRCFQEKTTIRQQMWWTLHGSDEKKLLIVHYVFVPPDLVMVHTEDVTER